MAKAKVKVSSFNPVRRSMKSGKVVSPHHMAKKYRSELRRANKGELDLTDKRRGYNLGYATAVQDSKNKYLETHGLNDKLIAMENKANGVVNQ